MMTARNGAPAGACVLERSSQIEAGRGKALLRVSVESHSPARLPDLNSSLYVSSEAAESYASLNTKHVSFMLFLFFYASFFSSPSAVSYHFIGAILCDAARLSHYNRSNETYVPLFKSDLFI